MFLELARSDVRWLTFAFALLLLIGSLSAHPASNEEPAAGQGAHEGEPAEPLPTFNIWEYRIEGTYALPAIAVERAVYPYLGEGRTIEDVERARKALEQAYQSAGYLTVFVDIPEQQVADGLVTLRVTEGKIAKVRITGNAYYSRGHIRAAVPALAEGTVPDFNRLQSQLAAVNRWPNVKVTPVLKPGAQPGQVEAELQVADTPPWSAEILLNNRQSPDTTPLRLQGSFTYSNLWQRRHSVSLLVQTAPQEPDELQVFSATYALPLNDQGNVLALYGVYSNSNVTSVGTTQVIGKGAIGGVRAILPLTPKGNYFHTAILGIDYKDFRDSLQLGNDEVETPVSYVPLSLGYRFNFPSGKTTNSGSLTLNFATGVVLGGSDTQFENKRFDASASYAYLRGDWLTELGLSERLGLQFTLQGQLTGQALISNEQFCAGGFDSVRGYLECEFLGDDGLIAGLELRRFLVLGPKAGAVESLYVLAFVQGGAVWVLQTLPGQESHYSLASVGVGMRAHVYKYFDAALDLALPLIGGPFTEQYDPRVLFSLAAQF